MMKTWHCDPCGKDYKSYHSLWKHKKICKANQRVLCAKCSKVMFAMDYKNHRQNCGAPGVQVHRQLQNASTSGFHENLHKQLQEAEEDTDTAHDDSQQSDGEMTTD